MPADDPQNRRPPDRDTIEPEPRHPPRPGDDNDGGESTLSGRSREWHPAVPGEVDSGAERPDDDASSREMRDRPTTDKDDNRS